MATAQPREWSHEEQQRLQTALRHYPASTEKVERWRAISDAVGRPGKECIAQCRHLAAAVGAKKAENKAADDSKADGKAAVDAAARLEAERRQAEAVSKQETAAQAKREAEAIAAQEAKAAAKAGKVAAARAAKKAASKEKKTAAIAPAAEEEPPVQGAASDAADEAGGRGRGKGAKGKGQAAGGKGKGRGGKGTPTAEQQADTGPLPAVGRQAAAAKGRGGKGGKGASSADAPQSAVAAAGQGGEPRREPARGKGRGGKGGKGAELEGGAAGGKGKRGGHKWWTRELLSEVDPISLEPLRSLRYPPFELRADPSLTHATSSDWFDGAVLAAYLIQTGHFSHPISRRELSRIECEALDAYLQQHRLMQRLRREGQPGQTDDGGVTKCRVEDGCVVHAYDHREEYGRAGQPASPGSRLAALRSDAEQILQSLFQGVQQDAEPPARGGGGGFAAEGAPGAAPRPVRADGNLTLIDDDLLPGHAAGRGAAAGAWGAADVRSAIAAAAEPFPTLPGAAPARAPAVVVRPPPRQVAVAAPMSAEQSAAHEKRGAEKSRARALASAFFGDEKRADCGSSFAASSAASYSAATLSLARAAPGFVTELEAALDAFVASGKRRDSLQPMPRPQRELTHELAKVYGLATASYDNEPRRHVDLFRTENTGYPGVKLSEAAHTEGFAAAPEAGWQVQLRQVECSEGTLAVMLRLAEGEYAVRWQPSKGGGPPDAALVFSTEGAARAALQLLGGGRRSDKGGGGGFTVVPPAWAEPGYKPPSNRHAPPPPPGPQQRPAAGSAAAAAAAGGSWRGSAAAEGGTYKGGPAREFPTLGGRPPAAPTASAAAPEALATTAAPAAPAAASDEPTAGKPARSLVSWSARGEQQDKAKVEGPPKVVWRPGGGTWRAKAEAETAAKTAWGAATSKPDSGKPPADAVAKSAFAALGNDSDSSSSDDSD